jgi:branched-chain amino acid transport system ATP-binding protein
VSAPVLETRGLTRTFGGLTAVDDVSLSVGEGQVLGIIGPNGAGKSTFVNLVTGHIKPTAGQVLVDGADLTGARPWDVARARVARTFQIVKPFRGLTVRENVAIGAMYGPGGRSSVSEASERADEVLARVGLADRADVAPGELSVADARRLELAKALAMRPRLLLLDEVMAGLRHSEIDPALELIRSLRDEGITVVAVEHVMRAILAVSDEVVVLHEGRELTRGRPEEVVEDERVIEAYLGQRFARRQRERRGNGDAATARTPSSAEPEGGA